MEQTIPTSQIGWDMLFFGRVLSKKFVIFSHWQVSSLSFFMLMGLLITFFFIPDVRDKDGRTKSLEELTDWDDARR